MRLIIFGAGGHARVACQVAERMEMFDDIAFSCCGHHPGQMMGHVVYDEEQALRDLSKSWDSAFVAIGDNEARRLLTSRVIESGFSLISLIDPSAFVSEYSVVLAGSIVCPSAVVNPFATVGSGCIINTAAIVEHDCELGSFVHLSPNVALGGGVQIGDYAWFGIGSSAVDHIKVASGVIVGAGACLIESACVSGTYVGVPARRIDGIT